MSGNCVSGNRVMQGLGLYPVLILHNQSHAIWHASRKLLSDFCCCRVRLLIIVLNNELLIPRLSRKGLTIVKVVIKKGLTPLQNKKSQKNLRYPTKEQSFSLEKDCFFVGYLNFFWPFLFWNSFNNQNWPKLRLWTSYEKRKRFSNQKVLAHLLASYSKKTSFHHTTVPYLDYILHFRLQTYLDWLWLKCLLFTREKRRWNSHYSWMGGILIKVLLIKFCSGVFLRSVIWHLGWSGLVGLFRIHGFPTLKCPQILREKTSSVKYTVISLKIQWKVFAEGNSFRKCQQIILPLIIINAIIFRGQN